MWWRRCLPSSNWQIFRPPNEWFGLPAGDWPGIQVRFGAADWSLFFTYAFATVVGTIETVGDAIVVQKVSQRDFRKVDYGVVQGVVYADGVGNFLSGLAGTTPNTTYSSNIALMELNGVAARRVGFYAAAFLALLAFFPKVSALVLDIPDPALGAAVFLLLCRLFVTGIRIATMEGITPETILVVGVAFCGGYAAENALLFPDLIPVALRPLVGNGIAAGGALALLLTLLVQLKPRARTTQRLPASLSQLPDLRRFVDRLEERFGVPAKSLHNLQLCSEEVLHISVVPRRRRGLNA